ncbi:fluoride efflux transporter CrcB [Altericista sp. CCNU0014]|uniref:fluoride efflux transporter CrcB n=1 Tax=Altericista sp. CCNU0014 TaxID=3082949 RepID=UPI00384B0440
MLGVLLSQWDRVRVGLSLIHPELRIPIAIALGAVPGALSRYYLTRWCIQWFGMGFPYGTSIVNLSGALAMGFFATFTMQRANSGCEAFASPELRALVAVGFLGAYTTFSTYALDATVLFQNGQWGKSLVYWSGSAILGVICLEIGSALARKLG